ncbi:hypothetical protein T459_34974 [Capsicum annuum]|uniref:Subtilisin-like protease fibronectin type-III domain-containing protein n=1 Tax=Capsicum annuum TaxID=4072 RepID=A0A2G2XUP2_CAPAN|nr:hypothetical protein T459_34974 [Capsicum annuum]
MQTLARNMTTVGLKDPHSGLPIIAEGMPFRVADPFDFGSGLVNAYAANNSGLIYDMGTFDYILYLRSMGYKSSHISNMIDEGAASCPIKRPSILDVNLSSLIVPSLKDTVNVRRTVTNVGPENSKYEAIIEPPPGITIKQERDRLLAKVENRAANTDGQAIKLQYTHSQKLKSLDAQEFAEAYKSFHVGEKLPNELATPYDKSKSHPAALSTKKYCIGMKQMFKIVQTVLPSRTSTPDGIGIVQIHWGWESLAYNLDHLHRFYNLYFLDLYSLEEIKYQGSTEDRLVLLKGVSGDFRPVVLIASMGVSGAGKTTLMDVLAGRKTGGYVNGDIKISGYPKKQETFVEKMKKRMRRTLKNVKILDGFCNLF